MTNRRQFVTSRLVRAMTCALALSAGAASAADPELDALLEALGRQDVQQTALRCRYVEHTVLDQLDDEGQREGRVIREYVVVQGGEADPQRELRRERIEGDPSGPFKRRYDGRSERYPGPFHPSEQAHFAYELVPSEDAGIGTVHFSPLKPHERRGRGTARVDLRARRILEMTFEPSKQPAFLDELQMAFTMGQTACGWQPVRFHLEGHGGFLFIKARFRSVTTMRGHELAGE